MPRFRREMLLSLLIFGGLACNDGGGPTAPTPIAAVASIEVSPASASVLEGETVSFRAVARNAQGEEIPATGVLWRSADPLIAQVDTNGVVVALPQHGTTRILVSIGEKRASGSLTSQARCSDPAPVEGVRNSALPSVIVMLRTGANTRRLVEDWAQKYGFEVERIYEALSGFSAPLTYAQIAQLRCEPEVETVSFDSFIRLA